MRVKGSLIAEMVVGIVTNITNKMSDNFDFIILDYDNVAP